MWSKIHFVVHINTKAADITYTLHRLSVHGVVINDRIPFVCKSDGSTFRFINRHFVGIYIADCSFDATDLFFTIAAINLSSEKFKLKIS